MHPSPSSIERQRRLVADHPDDPEANAELARLLAADDQASAAAGAYFAAACAARRRGDEPAFRRHLGACLACDPTHHLAFTSPPVTGQPTSEPGAVLLVHPDTRVCDEVGTLLAERGYRVATAATVDAVLSTLLAFVPDIVITAPALTDGLAQTVVIAACKRVSPLATAVLLTCVARREVAVDPGAFRECIDEHLDLPVDPERLLESVHASFWRRRRGVRPPAISSPGESRRRLRSDGLRAALIVGVGYGVIVSAAIVLQELSLEHAQALARAETVRFAARPPQVLQPADVVLHDGFKVTVRLPVRQVPAASGRFPGNTFSADQRYGHIEIEVQDMSAARLDPVAIANAILLEIGDQVVRPAWIPRIVDTLLAPRSPDQRGPRPGVTQATVAAPFPAELLDREGIRVLVLVGDVRFDLHPRNDSGTTP